MAFTIRMATPLDAQCLLDIYAPYVLDTTVSFELQVPTLEAFRARIEKTLASYAYLVVEHCDETADEGARQIVGYAYYGAFGERAAYQWSAETSIYIDRAWCGRGLGAHLLDALESCMAAQGITNSEACITEENTGSIAFHARHGYTERARFSQCAYKLGRWLGVYWMEKHLAEHIDAPAPIHPLAQGEVRRILAAENERLGKLSI